MACKRVKVHRTDRVARQLHWLSGQVVCPNVFDHFLVSAKKMVLEQCFLLKFWGQPFYKISFQIGGAAVFQLGHQSFERVDVALNVVTFHA